MRYLKSTCNEWTFCQSINKKTIQGTTHRPSTEPHRGVHVMPRVFSFWGSMYGVLSSADIGSENLRCLGDFRFTIGAVRELIRMQSFKIKFAYLPFEEDMTDDTRHDQSNACRISLLSPKSRSEILSRSRTSNRLAEVSSCSRRQHHDSEPLRQYR